MTTNNDDFQVLVNSNQVWFEGEISSRSISSVLFEISKINTNSFLFFSSEGGSVTSGLALYDFLNANHQKITVIAFDKCCSAATLILFSKCKTYAFANLKTVFHPIWIDFGDKSEALHGELKSNAYHHKTIDSILESKKFSIDWQNKTHVFFADYLLAQSVIDGFFDAKLLISGGLAS